MLTWLVKVMPTFLINVIVTDPKKRKKKKCMPIEVVEEKFVL